MESNDGKKKVRLIVAVTDNYAIGRNGGLVFNVKEDMRQFRRKTSGGVVIMGKRTFETLPNGPLPNRVNYVVSGKSGKDGKNLIFVNSVEKAIEEAEKDYPEKDIWVIGGGQVYRYCIEKGLVDEIHLTMFHRVVEDASTWFPILDEREWKTTEVEDYLDEELGLEMTFGVLTKESLVN